MYLLNEAASANPVAAYIQNIATATVHQASPKYFGRARCGWTYEWPTARARRTVPANSYRTLPHVNGIPGDIICDRCLPTERAAALGRDLVHDEVSGDEQPVDVLDDWAGVQAVVGARVEVFGCGFSLKRVAHNVRL